MLNFKLVNAHSKDCYALKNTVECEWSTPWSGIDPSKVEYLDAVGRQNGSGMRWHRIRCNCTQCPAEILVREDFLLGLLPSGRFASQRREAGR